MFSVDCSLHRRKFALSFSLWSRALNPFLLQIQSPLLREVLPFIVNPRFFIARTETILHGQWKMIFENRASPHWVLTSDFTAENFDAALLILKPVLSVHLYGVQFEAKTLTNRSSMRTHVKTVSGYTGSSEKISNDLFYTIGKWFSRMLVAK